MTYPLATSSWGEEEIEAAIAVLRSGRCTQGEITRQFEEEFARTFGCRHAVAVNSGSSANLLAVASQLYISDNPLRPGDEVLVPAVAWSTTYFPLHQCGLKIRLVDIDPQTMNMDLDKFWSGDNSKVRALFAVNLLGNPMDYGKVWNLCDRADIGFLEDSCESMGAEFDVETKWGTKGGFAGTFGKVGTFSSFFSHHICTIEGGMAVTDDDETADVVRCLRAHGWTRDLAKGSKLKQPSGDPWQDRYRFVLPGWNLRTDDLRSAIGLVQLKRLPTILEGRRKNAETFNFYLAYLNENELLATGQKETGRSSWYGFALVMQGRLQGKRKELVARLEAAGIETRPIMSGAIHRQPVAKRFGFAAETCPMCKGGGMMTTDCACPSCNGEGQMVFDKSADRFPNADYLHDNGFFLGNSHKPLVDELAQTFAIIREFADESPAA